MVKVWCKEVLVILVCVEIGASFEFFSTSFAVAGAATTALAMLVEITGWTSFKCTLTNLECCTKPSIKFNDSGLLFDLNKHLHGQHLVSSTVYRAVRSHMRNSKPAKPLVMSFHGWTGGGKNFVTRMIINNIYKKGEKSAYVHVFNAEVDFKHTKHVDKYKDDLQNWLHGNVSRCGRSIFIFDEMDHMPKGLIDAIKPYLGHNAVVRGVDYTQSMFIFLSNTGGQEIVTKCKFNWEHGNKREDLKLSDVQDILLRSAYNQKSGLFRSGIVDRNLIDHYIPFLPLERKHVQLCIQDEIRRLNYNENTLEMQRIVNEVMDQLLWLPEESRLYSKSGCKKIANKLALALEV